jgi:endonuclease IV
MAARFDNFTYGFHTKKLPLLYDTVHRVVSWKTVSAMQIYVSNGRGYGFNYPDIEDLRKTRDLVKESRMWICAHSKLVHNPAGAKELKNEKFELMLDSTRVGLTFELDVMAAIGGHGVVVHTGCSEDRSIGIEYVANTIIDSLTRDSPLVGKVEKLWGIPRNEFLKSRKIILENSAGEGCKLGGTLQDFVDILHNLKGKRPELLSQVGICIDTAHAFGAGLYDWGETSHIAQFYEDFEKLIGLQYLSLFHLNDSRRSDNKGNDAYFGSKKDRHANLGMGYVFEDREHALVEFFGHAYRYNVPMIGEPPKTTDDTDEPGPGGSRDFFYVFNLLQHTPHKLVTVSYPTTNS